MEYAIRVKNNKKTPVNVCAWVAFVSASNPTKHPCSTRLSFASPSPPIRSPMPQPPTHPHLFCTLAHCLTPRIHCPGYTFPPSPSPSPTYPRYFHSSPLS
eukprot:RCo055155